MSKIASDMTWINRNYPWLVATYEAEWVAVSSENVVAAAERLDHLLEKLGDGHGAFIMRMPTRDHLRSIFLAKQVRLN
jgi:hypothetical protein